MQKEKINKEVRRRNRHVGGGQDVEVGVLELKGSLGPGPWGWARAYRLLLLACVGAILVFLRHLQTQQHFELNTTKRNKR